MRTHVVELAVVWHAHFLCFFLYFTVLHSDPPSCFTRRIKAMILGALEFGGPSTLMDSNVQAWHSQEITCSKQRPWQNVCLVAWIEALPEGPSTQM